MAATDTTTRYTVTEKFKGADQAAEWTARTGRTVAVKIEAAREHGMWDTDLLRKALAEHAGVSVEDVRPRRTPSDRQVAPRVWEIVRPEAEEEAPAVAEEEQPAEEVPAVEDVDHRMFVGILREDAKDMGTVGADNVRAAITNANGWPVEHLDGGTIKVGYSFFEPVRPAVAKAPEGHGYTYADAQEIPARDLKIGDVFVALDKGDSYTGSAPGDAMGGTAWTVTERVNNTLTGRSHKGETNSHEIPAPCRVLRVAEGEVTAFADAYTQEIHDAAGVQVWPPAPVDGERVSRMVVHHRTTKVTGRPGGVIVIETDTGTSVMGVRIVTLTPVAEEDRPAVKDDVMPTPHTLYLCVVAEPVEGYAMAGTEVRADYVRSSIEVAARGAEPVKPVRVGGEGIIRLGSLMFIPKGLTTAA